MAAVFLAAFIDRKVQDLELGTASYSVCQVAMEQSKSVLSKTRQSQLR